MKRWVAALSLLLVAACSSKQTTSGDARKELEEKWAPRVGTATKADLVEEFGNAEWCRPKEGVDGEETCRFYRKKGTKWMGEKTDRKHIVQFDEVLADFDSKGVLRSYKTNAQR